MEGRRRCLVSFFAGLLDWWLVAVKFKCFLSKNIHFMTMQIMDCYANDYLYPACLQVLAVGPALVALFGDQ